MNSSTTNTQVIEISAGLVKELIAQLLYSMGKVPHSVDITNIQLPHHLDHNIPVQIKTRKRKEAKVTLLNGHKDK